MINIWAAGRLRAGTAEATIERDGTISAVRLGHGFRARADAGDYIGRKWHEVLHPDDVERLRAVIAALKRGGPPERCCYSIVRDGRREERRGQIWKDEAERVRVIRWPKRRPKADV